METKGRVTGIAINSHKVSFILDRKESERFVLYDETPNTQTIPQFEMATRSWMMAVLQTAFTTGKELVVNHNDQRAVNQIEVQDAFEIKIPPGTKVPGLKDIDNTKPVGASR